MLVQSVHLAPFRNDLLVVCSLIASLCPNAPFVETKFLKELCLFATFSEGEHAHLLSMTACVARVHTVVDVYAYVPCACVYVRVYVCESPQSLAQRT